MKNVVECYTDFLGYFNALETHGGPPCPFSVYGSELDLDQLPPVDFRSKH